MASVFNEQQFEQKLVSLKDTQEAITALSDWCIKNKQHHKKIVTCWLSCLKRVKIDLRLTLFYLANDVIQHSKRKHLDFVESWGTALQKATPLVRDEKVKQRVLRIFKIWEERGIYDEAFIADLSGLMTVSGKKKVEVIEDPTDFQASALLRKIKEVKMLKESTETKFKRISENKLPLTDAESMRLSLKERRHGTDVAAEVDSGVKKMEAYIRSLETEIGAREKLLCLLRDALLFYEKQRGEAKIVVYAYKSFGTRLKKQQQAVDELMTKLQSPLPSPDVNAPSPSPDSDLEARLRQQKVPGSSETNGIDLGMQLPLANSSFIGSSSFLNLSADVFSSESAVTPAPNVQTAQQIEVIGNHDTSQSFDVNEFFKTLMQPPQKEPLAVPPPVPPVFSDWSSPWDQPPPDSQPVHHQEIGYDPAMAGPAHLHDYNKPMLMPPGNFTAPPPPDYDKRIDYVNPLPVASGHDVDHRTLGAPPEVPPLDINPPQMICDMDHRAPRPLLDLPHPSMSDVPPLMPRIGQHPLLAPPPAPPLVPDIDQRNLINLTGRRGGYRGNQHNWNQRRPAEQEPVNDNVESIDMDFSEDDDESHLKTGAMERNAFAGQPPRPMLPGPPKQRPSLAERLREIQSYTPTQLPRDNNGMHEQEEETNQWQPRTPGHRGGRMTRPSRPGQPFRQQSPFRARPRLFRPRGRW